MIVTVTEQAERVFLVDDDRSILNALSRLLGAAGFAVEAFSSPREFLAQHDPQIPGCALLDIGMDECDGLALQETLTSSGSARPIIFLTGCDDIQVGVRAMKAGAVDYLTKPVQDVALIAAVQTALAYDRKERAEGRILDGYAALHRSLTPREREVMQHVVVGRLNKQIAHDLGTVEKTIKVHRAHIMEKMKVRSVAALVHIADALLAADARSPRR
jgi:FixJ family two-component response regulator